MRNLFTFTAVLVSAITSNLLAQCPQLGNLTLSPQPTTCSSAANIIPYFNQCRTICTSNVNATNSTGVTDLSCFGGSAPNDIWFKAPNPYANITNYDGSLVFRWVNWPGKAGGAPAPSMAMHAEVAGSAAGGLVTISMDCTSPAPTQSNNFAMENAFCINQSQLINGQFYAPPGTIPTVAQVNASQSQASITNIEYYMQVVASNNLTGDICFEVSPYKQGFVCGDPKLLTLSGNSTTVSGTTSACLCDNAIDGTLFSNVTNNLPVPCNVETPSAGWYAIQLPFACNKVNVGVSNWGGTGSYNLALLSNVSCPGTTATNPYTNQPVVTYGQTLQPGAVVQQSACNQPLNSCQTLPAGTYWVYISGATERPTFSLNVSVTNASSAIGSVSSAQNNTSVCSGSTVGVQTSGSSLPLNASCGQNIRWYASTDAAFNPYNNQGIYLASGSGNVTLTLPSNTTCQAQTYYIKGIISDNGTTAVAGCKSTSSTIQVTVYPEIGQSTVSNTPCLIQVAPRCPSFTINGTAGTANYTATFAENGTSRNFIISNGLAACNQTINQTITCSGNCTQPSATSATACNANDPYNYYVDVTLTPGSASSYTVSGSDGSSLIIPATAGVYRAGPFANSNSVTLNLTNTNDANCNILLGSFSRNCNPSQCSNLTSATASIQGGGTSVCASATSQITLQATVNAGVINQDFSVQWYVNGTAITGANTLTYNHRPSTSQSCNVETQNYSVRLTCLNASAAPSTVASMNISNNPITVYPLPRLGIDFTQSNSNCVVAPVSVCGNLSISYTPTTNPAVGSGYSNVNYTASIVNAPTGCSVSGSYSVPCPAATCNGGSVGIPATPSVSKVCRNSPFTLNTTGASLPAGWALGYAWTTTDPGNNLYNAVTQAITSGNVLGPYTANQTVSLTNNGSVFPSNTPIYFIPFTSLNITSANQFAYNTTGTQSYSFGGSSATTNIGPVPSLPFCQGITAFATTLTASRVSGTGSPIDGAGGILPYTGSSTNALNLSNTNYTSNPSGVTQTILGSSAFGATINYNFLIQHAQAYPFPRVCPTCSDLGTPIVYEMLPDITLSSITAPRVCQGSSIDLATLNPTSNVQGTYSWYLGLPSAGSLLNQTNVTPTSTGSVFYVKLEATANSACTASTAVTLTGTALPTVNSIPSQPAVCNGTSVNLNALNASISTATGTFNWFRGAPTSSNAVRYTQTGANAVNVVAGATYYGQFTLNSTGCSSSSSVTFTVNPLPVLTPSAISPSVCAGSVFNLTTLQAGMTSSTGTFTWHQGSTGTAISNPSSVTPTASANVYCAKFTDGTTGCSSTLCVTLNINAPTALTAIPQVGPSCYGSTYDLSSYHTQMTAQNGQFQWYLGNPTSGGLLQTSTNVTPTVNGAAYYTLFTNALTGCVSSGSVSFLITPSPTLNSLSTQSICAGSSVNLTTLQSQLATSAGSFVWYNGNPNAGGTAMTNAQATSATPTSTQNTYWASFSNGFNCSAAQSVTFSLRPTPVLSTVPDSNVCHNSVVNLVNLQTRFTNASGTFNWSNGGTTLSLQQAQQQTIVGNNTYTLSFTDNNGCSSAKNIRINGYAPLSGATANYDCINGTLNVSLANTTGGSGTGYAVAPNSPNRNGQTFANGYNWAVWVIDSKGCQQAPLTGSVNCFVCNAGTATLAASTVCCNSTLAATATNASLSSGNAVVWVITNDAAGPLTDTLNIRALAAQNRVLPSALNAQNTLNTAINCANLTPGYYHLTPVTAVASNNAPLVYDTLAGCRPNGNICPQLIYNASRPNWVIDTLFISYPNGQKVDLVQQLAGFHLPLNPGILTLLPGGSIPCLPMTTLYRGNPNGTWSFSGFNSGTDTISLRVPSFQVGVSATTCAQLNGRDQTYTVPTVSMVVPPNQFRRVSFVLPPTPANFPEFSRACYAIGRSIRFLVDVCTSIETTANRSNGLQVFPNPAEDKIQLTIDLGQQTEFQYDILNALGQKLIEVNGKRQQTGSLNESIDVSQLPDGQYFIRAIIGNSTQSVSFIKH